MKVFNLLKKIDAYPKTLDEVNVKSLSGAGITIISSFLIIFLVVLELIEFYSPYVVEEIIVDSTRNNKLRINLNLRIHNVACNILSIDAMDLSGKQHLRISHSIFKQRLSLEGKPLELKPIKEIFENAFHVNTNASCGSCYGAENNNTSCCNTCQEVVDAYTMKKWSLQIDKIKQCKEKNRSKETEKVSMEGCEINGYIEVNRISGSFHIAPGTSYSISQFHVHDYINTPVNFSHTINHLSFGEKIQFASTHPLDGLEVHSKSDGKSQMFNYYLKVIPTIYFKNKTNILNTNQFSVTRYVKTLNEIERGLPGLFFSYELSSLMVKFTEKKRSIGHLIINCCSILGGLCTVAGITAKLLQTTLESLNYNIFHSKLN